MSRVADLLHEQLDSMLTSWSDQVSASARPAGRSTPELAHHGRSFLQQIITTLREPPPAGEGPPAGEEYGSASLRLGFDLEAVAREYDLLLDVVIACVERAEATLSIREMQRISRLVTRAAMAAAAERARRLDVEVQASAARVNERLSQIQGPAIFAHVTGPRHVVSFANRGFTQLVGGRPLAGLSIAEAMPELENQPFVGLLDGVYATGETFVAHEIPASLDQTGDGTLTESLFDLVYQATRDGSGQIDGVLIQAVDVTAAAATRSEAARLRAQLETTLSSMGDGVLALDAVGRIMLLNPAAEQLTGWRAGEALGQPVEAVLKLVHARTRAALPSPFADVLRGGPTPSFGNEVLFLRRDGSTFAFADSLAPIRDREGAIAGAVLVFRDETEARRKDAELRTFRAALDACNDFVAFGSMDGRPSYVNPAGLRLIGIESEAAACALTVPDFYLPEARTTSVAEMMALLQAGQPFQGDTVLRHFGTGEPIPVSQSAFTVSDPSGRPVMIGTIIRDRREHQRAEAERERLLVEAQAAHREADLQRERLTVAFTQAPVAVGILRGDDDIVVLANEGVCRIWGNTHEALIGRPLFDLLPDAKAQGFPALLAEVRRTGEAFVGREVSATVPRLGGGTEDVILNFVYQPLRQADGSVTDILAVATDVTVEVRARRAAEATSAEFEAMFNSLPDGAYLADTKGIRRANPAGLALLGFTSVEQLHAPSDELAILLEMREVDNDQLGLPGRSASARALAGEVVRAEYLCRNLSTGRETRLRSIASPIRVGGAIVGAVILHADITEQHRAIEALHRSEESFRTLSEAIPQQVWTSRLDGSLDFVNQRVLDYFAATQEEILGAGWLAVLHPDDVAGCVERWTRSLATGEDYNVEFRLRRGDGAYRWHLGRARAARDTQGAISKWFGTNTDIDEAKRVREELEKRTSFEQHLLGIVSHDLRNPLGAILLGATALLDMEAQDEWVTKVALRIRSSAERSTRMISDLLDFTQARLGGGIRIEPRPADLHALASSTLEEVEMAYPDRSITLTRAGVTRGTWDPDRIAQVLTNLTTNALKYSPAGTPVAVRVAGEDGSVVLAIHNEGPPIPPTQLGRIFEPLQRASEEIDLKTRSVGLGLYIVEAIVSAHGGTVGVVSTAAAGTTFTVRLPREPVTAKGT